MVAVAAFVSSPDRHTNKIDERLANQAAGRDCSYDWCDWPDLAGLWRFYDDGDAQLYADGDVDRYTVDTTVRNAEQHHNAQLVGNTEPNVDLDPELHAQRYADVDRNLNGNCNVDADTHVNADSIADVNLDPDGDIHSYRFSYPDFDRKPDADRFGDGIDKCDGQRNRDADRFAEPDGHRYADAESRAAGRYAAAVPWICRPTDRSTSDGA